MLGSEKLSWAHTLANPFPGLRRFESFEEPLFRGRQSHTDELLRRLAEHRFIAVVGTSGSGKSSLVRAGLLPALERGYLAGATSLWRFAVVQPGMAPIANLADALCGKDVLQAALDGVREATLRSSSLGLVEAVKNAKLSGGESLLIVADQFEEIFRYERRMSKIDGGLDAARFVSLLLTAARRPDVPVYVVLTMRSDFLGDCAQFPGLPEALSESQYLIPRLTRQQRRQAVEEPLRLFGAAMTPQLIEQMLNDSGDEPGDAATEADVGAGSPDPLPVLQHALMRTYLEWKALPHTTLFDPIDLAQYRNAGRMELALDNHAEQLFEKELDAEGRNWTERIFRCLTTTELGRPVRRPTPLTDLYKIVGARREHREKVDSVLAIFTLRENSFIQLNKDGSADITHESLIWKWKRLKRWVTEESASAELYRDLAKDTKRKSLWGEPKLSAALLVRQREAWNGDWARQYSDSSFPDVESFLERSKRAARNLKILRWFAAVIPVFVVISAIIVFYQIRQMDTQRQKAVALLATQQALSETYKQNQSTLVDRINSLNLSAGSNKGERDRIANEKAQLEAQLQESKSDSQRLSSQSQQQTDLVANVKALQNQLLVAQRDRDDLVKKREDAESKGNQLEAELAATRLAAQRDRDDQARKLQVAESEVIQLEAELKNSRPAGKQVAPAENRPSVSDDTALLQAAVKSFQAAYNAQDLPRLQEVWPGINLQQAKKLRSFFKENPAASVSEECSVSSLKVSGDTSNWTCTEATALTRGGILRPQKVLFTFAKVNGSWTIADRKILGGSASLGP